MMPNLFRAPRGADFTPDRAFYRIKDYFAAPSAPGPRLVMDVSTAMRWIGSNAVEKRWNGIHPHFWCWRVAQALISVVARGQHDADLQPVDAVGPGRCSRR